MTGYPEHNFPAFFAAAKLWEKRGWEVVNPAELDGENTEQAWRYYLKRDICLLVSCDAIALLPGWQQSKGAQLEAHIAAELGLRRFDAMYPAAHPVTDHDFVEGTNVCCNEPDYMHLAGWRAR
jgi:hypothetical protein